MTEYRYNVMNISSVDSFLNIKGGYHQDLRDVYFVRALGEPNRFADLIREADTIGKLV